MRKPSRAPKPRKRLTMLTAERINLHLPDAEKDPADPLRMPRHMRGVLKVQFTNPTTGGG